MNIKLILKKIAEEFVNVVSLKSKVLTARLPILFVHVPKTAGTSFRRAAEKSWLIQDVLCDYGKGNDTTSEDIELANYSEDSKQTIDHVLAKYKSYLFTGHFPVTRYQQYFYPYEIGIFVRDPVDRVVSNYYHKKRNDNFEGSIADFINTNAADNLQAKQFGELALEYFGFIGISERYEESLTLVNALYNLDLKTLTLNTNPQKKSTSYELDEQTKQAIAAKNTKEFDLYNAAKALFESRQQFLHVKYPLYGSWRFVNQTKIIGRAYRAWSNSSVKLILKIDDKFITKTTACLHNPIPCEVKQPNKGCIGFVFDLQVPITSENEVKIYAADTGEPIMNLHY